MTAPVLNERIESRRITTDKDGNVNAAEFQYQLLHESSSDSATALAYSSTADNYNGCLRDSVTIEPVFIDVNNEESCIWDVRVNYSKQSAPEVDGSVFNFDTTGGTQHVKYSKYTRSSVAAPTGPGVIENYNAIGVSASGGTLTIEGIDVTVPVYSWTETHKKTNATLNQAAVYNLTGKVNSTAFKGFADGLTPVQVESLTGKEEFADIKDGDSTCLKAGGGSARIIWLPPESDDVHYSPGSPTKVWGIVQLGPGGGGVRYAVLVTIPTGDPVSNTWGNIATGNPCPDATGANADTETEIELYCTSPLTSDRVPGPGGSHLIFTLAVGQVVAYLPLADGKGIIVSPDYDWNNLVEAKPHELLSEKHSDTDAEAIPAAGDMIVYCDDLWTTLPVGNQNQVLQVRNNLPTWQNLPNGDHVLLDGDVHTDTAQNVIPFPGDMIIRDGQNQWNVLIAGGDTQSLRIDPATHVPAWMDTWPAGGAIGDFLAWHKDDNNNTAPLWSPPVHGLLAPKYHDDVAPFPADYSPEKGALIAGVTQGNVKFWAKEPPAAANDLVLTSDNTQDSGVKWAAPRRCVPDGTAQGQILYWSTENGAWMPLDPPASDGKTYVPAVNNGMWSFLELKPFECPS